MTTPDAIPPSLTPAQARQHLAERGLQYTEDHFLRHVRGGNLPIVLLYLQAGMSPNTRLDGETALSASANAGQIEVTRALLQAGADPMGLTDGLRIKDKQKDVWERLSSMSGVFTFVASLVVAGVGWYFTREYNNRQLAHSMQQSAEQNRMAELQTVERMIPHLVKDEASKHAALIAIDVLANRTLAAKMAQAYGGQGSIDALTQFAISASPTTEAPAVDALTNLAKVEQGSTERPAHDALARVLAAKQKSLIKVLWEGKPACNGFVVNAAAGWIATPYYCVKDRNAALISIQFDDGSRFPMKHFVVSRDGLIAFVKTAKIGLADIKLSKMALIKGSIVSQLSHDLARNRLGIVLGRVIDLGPMKFAAPGVTAATAIGLKVRLAGDEDRGGTAGGPLLDSEGNAACMTYLQGTGVEQCLAADAIAEAMKDLARG